MIGFPSIFAFLCLSQFQLVTIILFPSTDHRWTHPIEVSAVLVLLFPFPPVVTCRQDCDSSTMTDDRLILTGSNTVLNLILHPTTVQDKMS